MRNDLRFCTVAFLLCCAFLCLLQCDSNKTTNPTGGSGGNADSILAIANDSLSSLMNEVVNQTLDNPDSTLRPHDIDFSGLRSIYQQALSVAPDNDSARFGVAFTGLMSFLTDSDLNELFNRFKDVYDTSNFLGDFFPVPAMGGKPLPTGMPLEPSLFETALPDLLEFDRMIRLSAAVGDPAISELQEMLETSLLPKVMAARNQMLAILQRPNFVFIISPAMQGNPGASPIELDQADFRVITATLYGIEASLHIFFARNLDLTSYNGAGLEDALRQESEFLSLKSDGASEMASAKTALLAGEEQVEMALDALTAEITADPDQSNDLIPIYPRDAANIVTLKADLQEYRAYFDGPTLVTIISGDYRCYWDMDDWYCYGEDDTLEVMVDISKFFDDPVENFKTSLPAYSATVTDGATAYRQFAAAHFSRQRYLDMLMGLYGVSDDTDPSLAQYDFFYHLPSTDNNEFYSIIGYGQFVFGWDDRQADNWSDSLYFWYNYSAHQNQYWDYYWGGDYWEICYTWDAVSFDTWTFPDPTLNGLLPEMTSQQLKDYYVQYGGDWMRSSCFQLDL